MAEPNLTTQQIKRFWSYVDKTAECWIWNGARQTTGYGTVGFNGKLYRAHRIAYVIANGPVPDGLYVLHSCDCPPCCNPAHLRAGTQKENMADIGIKGRRGNAKPLFTDRPPTDKSIGIVTRFPLGERYLEQLQISDGCWVWAGYHRNGYAMICVGVNQYLRVSHLSYAIYRGAIPTGAVVFYTCGNSSCVNPDHLAAGSRSDCARNAVRHGHAGTVRGEAQPTSKLTNEDVRRIRHMADHGVPIDRIATHFPVRSRQIRRIIDRVDWKHI